MRRSPQRTFVWLMIAILIGVALRCQFLWWQTPWEPHHPDEHILPQEAISLWEGITPREVGWPASTTRLTLSVIEGVRWGLERGGEAWRVRAEPAEAFGTMTTWIGEQYLNPAGQYRSGRWLSCVTGVLQLIALAYMLRRWCGPVGVAAGVLAIAVSPVTVLHSQYVLADITALLFATLAVSNQQPPSRDTVVVSAAFAALAAASKLHFGIWLLAPLLSIWLTTGVAWRARLAWTALAVLTFGLVMVALFPWVWLNPILALKEFGGVVFVKLGHGTTGAQKLRNATYLVGGLGAMCWLGAVMSLPTARWSGWRSIAPVAVPSALGLFALSGSEIVFDRYALVLLPGLAIMSAVGWERALLAASQPVRIATAAVLVLTALAAGASTLSAERTAGETDVDVQVKQWILANVDAGARVALHDESNAVLPRAASQLIACAAAADSPDGYRKKWATLGYRAPATDTEPMRLVLLNDELTFSYWCRRELDAQHGAGYVLIGYHNEPRWHGILESTAIEQFDHPDGVSAVDVLVMNRMLPGHTAAAQFSTQRGRRFVFVRKP